MNSSELVRHSPVAMIVTRGPEYKLELVNDKFTSLFGYTIDDVPDEAHWWPLAYPDEAYRELVKTEWHRRVGEALMLQANIEPMEARVCCKDGSTRYIEFHFTSFGDTSLISFVDLTERQLAQTQVRESEERFRLVANTAPVMIWMSGQDKLCSYFNQPWLDFTGRPLEAELGSGWAEAVHPDELQSCIDVYTHAFELRESFTMQYRLRRHDGEFRWVLDTGVPRFNPNGSFAGYIGSCIDITERKVAEEALASLGGKLIAAQEAERTRIARELHDDINQQLALLSVSLDCFGKNPPGSPEETRCGIEEFVRQISEVSHNVQALSHRLHSSKLDYLGLVAAMQGFCREFSDQHHVEVNFSHDRVPDTVPKEISLCLFRVMQAALVNAFKHSGVKSFDVQLRGTSEGIRLAIQDRGAGFDAEKMLSGHGIGLISMRERVRLVNGHLSIQSQPNAGTTIGVDVSLAPLGAAMSASRSA